VPSPGETPAKGDASLLPATVPDIGRALRQARELADLTLAEAAARADLRPATADALEVGNVGPQHDRIETLRALRSYANALGLPGNDYVLVAIEHWPSGGGTPPTPNETAVVPVISISSAPPGGHSPVSAPGTTWPADRTGVPDATITGVLEPVRPLAITDTGRVPVVDTGEIRAVRTGAPRFLSFLVGLTAVLIVLGALALVENQHLDHWYHNTRSAVTRWVHDAKSAVGISSQPKSSAHHTTSTTAASHAPAAKAHGPHLITFKKGTNPTGRAETISVAAPSFTVKVVAYNAPCWVQATTLGQSTPDFEQTMPAGQVHVFTVTSSMTIETGSSAGRAFIYRGTKLIGFYFPTKTPFTMTFNATN
jgi:cytoskeletal protein RodZ